MASHEVSHNLHPSTLCTLSAPVNTMFSVMLSFTKDFIYLYFLYKRVLSAYKRTEYMCLQRLKENIRSYKRVGKPNLGSLKELQADPSYPTPC